MKRGILLILAGGALGLLLAGLVLRGASAGVNGIQAASTKATQQLTPFWVEDFSAVPVTGTYYITATPGSGVVDSGSFKLTQDLSGERGRIFNLRPTLMGVFSATFRFNLGNKDWQGADGLAFNICPAYDYPPDAGGTLDASCPGGYMVAFDTFEYYDSYPDEIYIASGSYANRLSVVTLSSNLEDGNWHDVAVIFDQGAITVTLDTSTIFAGYNIPGYVPFTGYFGFSSATGMYSNEQRVDDIQVQLPAFWTEDFSVDPPSGVFITSTTGSGLVDNGSFLLTKDEPGQRGRIFYLQPSLMSDFSADFRMYLGNHDGADGIAFNICPGYDYPPDAGGTLDASCPGGYMVAFDTYEGAPDRVYVARESYANRLVQVDVPDLENGSWHAAQVVYTQGKVTVFLDGNPVIAGFEIPGYVPFVGYFGFSGATGAAYNEQRIDDIEIIAKDSPFGHLNGHVYDAETTASIESASIIVEWLNGHTWSVETDSTGYYTMTVAAGTYTVTAEHPDYVARSATGVEVAEGALATVDFNLWKEVVFEPSPLHVTLDWGETQATPATLSNRQPWNYDFKFLEMNSGFDPSLCMDASCEETYGSTANQFSGGTRDRGNIFEATEEIPIHEIRVWLDFTAPSDLYFFIYEGAGLTGSFNKIYEVQANAGTGAQWHSSGPVNVLAEAGKFYYVGASWNGIAGYAAGNQPVPITTNCFGILRTGTGSIAGYPPAPTANNTWTGNSPYHFAIVTGNDVAPWFGQDPITGTVPASSTLPGELTASMLFTATAEAGVNQPGDYFSTLVVDGDPRLSVPVTMTVLPAADMGRIVGSLTDNCTGEPVEGAQVSILSGDPITQTWTDAAGHYSAWLFSGSYEVVFSATGYLPFTDTVDIIAGQVASQDAVLVPEHACINVTPDALEAWVLAGTTVYTHPTGLEIINNGGGDLEFQIFEAGGLPEVYEVTQSPQANNMEKTELLKEKVTEFESDRAMDGLEGGEMELEKNAKPGQIAPKSPMIVGRVLWDDTHDSDGDDLLGNYLNLYNALTTAGYDVVQLDSGPIDLSLLANYDILVIVDAEVALSSSEIAAIQTWVNAGNGLLAISEWGTACDKSTYNTLLAPYAIQLLSQDTSQSVMSDITAHSITQGVAQVTGNGWGGLAITFPAIDLIRDGTGLPVLAASAAQRVVEITDSNLMDNGYYAAANNAVLMANIFAWLMTEEDVPWVWEEPISATVSTQSTFNVEILFTSVITDPLPLGTYTATLMVFGNAASAPRIPVTMHVVEAFTNPVAGFEISTPVILPGEMVVFTNTSTEGTPATEYYVWDFGDGSTQTTTTADPVSHSYTEGGIYTVKLTAHQAQTGLEVVYTDTIMVLGKVYLPVVVHR